MSKHKTVTTKTTEKTLGYLDVGAFEHRNDGGEIKVKTYSKPNDSLQVDAAKETRFIGGTRFKIVEEEIPYLKNDSFYEKRIWNEQVALPGEERPSAAGNVGPYETIAPPRGMPEPLSPAAIANAGPSPLQVLKNFVDNIAADVRNHTLALIVIGMMAAAALVLAII